MKQTLFLLLAVSAASVFAEPVAIPASGWSGNPIGWADRGNVLQANSASGFVHAKGFARGRQMSLVAEVTPKSVSTNTLQFATFGVSAFENASRFWHLALVRLPLAKGGRHAFELCERHGDRWPAQYADKMKDLPGGRVNGTWAFGETYRLEIRIGNGKVEGIVRKLDGTMVYRRGYALKDDTVNCGAPALHATGGFSADVASVQAECADCIPDDVEKPLEFPAYENGPRPISARVFRATGFFRLEKAEDGRWRAIDPTGREVVPIGVNSVNYDGCSSRGPLRRYRDWNNAHYPNREAWAQETLARLKTWGFNRLSGGNANLYHRGFMHSRNLSLGSRLCSPGMAQEYWICPNPGKPCAAFPNVFHPHFRAWCAYVAKEQCAPYKNDPWLFGYYSDNELAWWGRGARDVGLYNETLKLPADHTAHQALVAFAQERGYADPAQAPAEVRLDFLRLAADIYFRETTAAIHAADPNHLALGARFAGLGGAHEAVWEIAGKYCDLVTFNIYPWADLDRNVVRVNSTADSPRVFDAFAERYAIVKKPFLITEWSFPSLDSGLPCTRGAGQRFSTQAERTQATELFARTMLASPCVLGYDYFMWVDEPPEGVSDTHPEDTNYGLVSEQGKPYPLTDMFARLHADIVGVRAAGLPAERPAPPAPPAPTAAEIRAQLLAAKHAGPAALVLPPLKTGKGPIFKGIACADGGILGDFTMMLSHLQNGSRVWSSIASITDVKDLGGNRWSVTCEKAGKSGFRYAFTLEIVLPPDASQFLIDVVELRNLGKKPLEICGVYFRTEAPYAAESVAKQVPNAWKRPCRARWQAPDGRWIGEQSRAATASRFSFGYSAERKSQHPDALFEPPVPLVLKPGEAYRPEGTMWCIVEGGREQEK